MCETSDLIGENYQYNADTDIKTVIGKYVAATAGSKDCPICGSELVVSVDYDANAWLLLSGEWYLLPKEQWRWRCGICSFVGTWADFLTQAKDIRTFPDFEPVGMLAA